jgi:MYXO-CTERM domain-containing protein
MQPIAAVSASVILAAVIAMPGGAALAQCPDPVDQVLVFPSDGASGVPTNVVLRAEFPPTRDPRGAPVWTVLDSRGQTVTGDMEWDGFTSTFTPTPAFADRSYYSARVTAQATASYWDFDFTTGSATDDQAPTFGGVTDIAWTTRLQDWLLPNCRLARGDGFVITLDLGEASDDVTEDADLSLYIYQTAGPGAASDDPTARIRLGDESQVSLFRGVDDGEGEFCFRAQVRDLAGRFDGNSSEVCDDAVAGAIFSDICSTAGANPAPGAPASIGAVLVVAALLVIRRRRAR